VVLTRRDRTNGSRLDLVVRKSISNDETENKDDLLATQYLHWVEKLFPVTKSPHRNDFIQKWEW
jgi:hypothetical protein